MQIATETVDAVFLIDLMMLHRLPGTNDEEEERAALEALLRWLMSESRLMTIGF